MEKISSGQDFISTISADRLGENVVIVVFIALIVDYLVGEFPVKHPVEYMGDFIRYFEKNAYENSISRGFVLLMALLAIVGLIAFAAQLLLHPIIAGILASTGLASKSLKQHVKKVLNEPDKKVNLSALVTRNTHDLDDKKIYSTLIETHSENLSDGYIAPLFYLMLFGLPGIMLYKAVSTLDSMIGYKNEKYIKFGRASAIADDILNYVPARITGVLIWLLGKSKIPLKKLFQEAKKYSSSPNAGYPVAAAAYALGVTVGGTVYYGDVQVNKAMIGAETTSDYSQAAEKFLQMHSQIEKIIFILVIIGVLSAL